MYESALRNVDDNSFNNKGKQQKYDACKLRVSAHGASVTSPGRLVVSDQVKQKVFEGWLSNKVMSRLANMI